MFLLLKQGPTEQNFKKGVNTLDLVSEKQFVTTSCGIKDTHSNPMDFSTFFCIIKE